MQGPGFAPHDSIAIKKNKVQKGSKQKPMRSQWPARGCGETIWKPDPSDWHFARKRAGRLTSGRDLPPIEDWFGTCVLDPSPGTSSRWLAGRAKHPFDSCGRVSGPSFERIGPSQGWLMPQKLVDRQAVRKGCSRVHKRPPQDQRPVPNHSFVPGPCRRGYRSSSRFVFDWSCRPQSGPIRNRRS